MTIKGKAASEFMRQLREKRAQEHAERFATAKREAQARGKEPFDMAKLASLCATTYEATSRMTDAEKEAYFEEMYYLDYPSIMTVEDLAEKVRTLSRWM